MTTRRHSPVTRRQFLAASAAALAAGLAGCASDGSACDGADRSSVAAERAIPPADVRESVEPIRYEELPAAEKDVAAKAIRGDSYAECAPASDAFESFLDRIADHRAEQQRGSDADLTTVYLVRERSYYALEATVREETVSW